MGKKFKINLLIVFLIGLMACGESDNGIPSSVVGRYNGSIWAFRQSFGETVLINQDGVFDATLDLNGDQTFTFTESVEIVDNIFDEFEFPKSGSYNVAGSETVGTIFFTTDDATEVQMRLFRTDSSITLTYKEEVSRNGGINDIEIDLFFLNDN